MRSSEFLVTVILFMKFILLVCDFIAKNGYYKYNNE